MRLIGKSIKLLVQTVSSQVSANAKSCFSQTTLNLLLANTKILIIENEEKSQMVLALSGGLGRARTLHGGRFLGGGKRPTNYSAELRQK